MKKFALAMMAAASLTLAGCAQSEYGQMNKQNVGAVSGALLGGVLGSQVGGGSGRLWATGAGAVVGALMGSEIGRSLDRADQMYMQQAQSRAHAAPIGESISWSNPDTGHRGYVTPVRDGTSTSGRYCREYQVGITVGGQQEQGYGTACQQPDGSWEVVS